MKTIRRHYLFSGHVQGVGFRYTASHAAGMYGVTGWVMNRWDGCVEMEAQGTEEALDRMLERLEANRWARIDRIETTERLVIEENGFREVDW